jgi:hypothetical protein
MPPAAFGVAISDQHRGRLVATAGAAGTGQSDLQAPFYDKDVSQQSNAVSGGQRS